MQIGMVRLLSGGSSSSPSSNNIPVAPGDGQVEARACMSEHETNLGPQRPIRILPPPHLNESCGAEPVWFLMIVGYGRVPMGVGRRMEAARMFDLDRGTEESRRSAQLGEFHGEMAFFGMRDSAI